MDDPILDELLDMVSGQSGQSIMNTSIRARVARKFCASLQKRYHGCLAREAPPSGISWLNSGIIFRALETCRTEVGELQKAADVFCRYTIRKKHEDDRDPKYDAKALVIRDYLDVDREINE